MFQVAPILSAMRIGDVFQVKTFLLHQIMYFDKLTNDFIGFFASAVVVVCVYILLNSPDLEFLKLFVTTSKLTSLPFDAKDHF